MKMKYDMYMERVMDKYIRKSSVLREFQKRNEEDDLELATAILIFFKRKR